MTLPCTHRDRENQSFIECDGKPAKRVWICPDTNNPVPVTFNSTGSPIKESFIGLTSAINPILEVETVAGKLRTYTQVIFICRKTVTFKVKNNGVQFLSVRLGPANPTVAIRIENGEDIIAGEKITIEIVKSFSTPDVDVEVYIRGGESDI